MQRLFAPLVASLTLGLAPFAPEPHIVGKLRWIAGGAVGMGPMDWFDTAMHGLPWLWLGASVVAFFFLPAPALADLPTVTVQELHAKGAEVLLIDVRTEAEWSEGHVAHARFAPLSELEARVEALKLPRDQPVYVICRSGARSARAAATLAKAGFQAVNVNGGTMAWTQAGFPVEVGE